jgi:hypothetical protein
MEMKQESYKSSTINPSFWFLYYFFPHSLRLGKQSINGCANGLQGSMGNYRDSVYEEFKAVKENKPSHCHSGSVTCQVWWCTSIIPASWQAEIRRNVVQDQLRLFV